MSIPRPNAEVAWLAWLKAGGFNASTRIPSTHTNGMIRLSRVGGKRRNLVQDEVLLLVEVWHSDAFASSQRAHAIAEYIESADDGTALDPTTRVSDVVTSGPVEFPDESSSMVRYQFTVECLLRRVA